MFRRLDDKGATLLLKVDGREIRARDGDTVTAALLAHEFSDSAAATRQASRESYERRGLRDCFVSSLCLTAGLAATCFHGMAPGVLGAALALFGGYFIYLSASDLIPESHHLHPQLLTVALTFSGDDRIVVAWRDGRIAALGWR